MAVNVRLVLELAELNIVKITEKHLNRALKEQAKKSTQFSSIARGLNPSLLMKIEPIVNTLLFECSLIW